MIFRPRFHGGPGTFFATLAAILTLSFLFGPPASRFQRFLLVVIVGGLIGCVVYRIRNPL